MNTETALPRPRLKPMLAQGGHGGPDCRCEMILGRNRHLPMCPNRPKAKVKPN